MPTSSFDWENRNEGFDQVGKEAEMQMFICASNRKMSLGVFTNRTICWILKSTLIMLPIQFTIHKSLLCLKHWKSDGEKDLLKQKEWCLRIIPTCSMRRVIPISYTEKDKRTQTKLNRNDDVLKLNRRCWRSMSLFTRSFSLLREARDVVSMKT